MLCAHEHSNEVGVELFQEYVKILKAKYQESRADLRISPVDFEPNRAVALTSITEARAPKTSVSVDIGMFPATGIILRVRRGSEGWSGRMFETSPDCEYS